MPDVPELPGTGPQVMLWDSGARELRATAVEGPATMYVCGITPYDATHLGHAYTYMTFDLLVRAWRDAGREVTYVQNITDIDDPLLERAEQIGVDWRELAAEQVELFRQDMAALRVIPPNHYVSAVDTIPLVVESVTKLLDQGHAYRVPLPPGAGGDHPELGDVYADAGSDPYFAADVPGTLAEKVEIFAERGGDPQRDGKRHPLDALLWRRTRPAEPDWEGAGLGRGRPGWHIECAVIAHHHLPVPFEVHGGGNDLIFPHHAWSESHLRMLTGVSQPAAVSVHAGMVGYNGTKMSKSLGNLVLVSQLRDEGHDPMAVRLVLMANHYRADWEYVPEDLTVATHRLARWRKALALPTAPAAEGLLAEVRAALADDLDAPRALRAVDDWVDQALSADNGQDRTAEGAALAAATVDALLGVR